MRSLLCFFALAVTLILASCTKLDSTSLGSDLIPEVDNVNTFDTTLDVEVNTYFPNDDTIRLSNSDQLAVGQITNDPLFGGTNAQLFLELKPTFPSGVFRDTFNLAQYDSTVLCLRFTGAYGDTTSNVEYQVYRITDTVSREETSPRISKTYGTEAVRIGSKVISPRSLNRDSIPFYRSTAHAYKTFRELRIPLSGNDNWWQLLKDSATLSGDSLYRVRFKGFAVRAVPVGAPGSLSYFRITDTATRLEFYYRRRNGTADTTHTAFYFNANNSGFANNIRWNRSGEVLSHLTPKPQGDSLIYLKTTPGTYARIRIPNLQNISNRMIHRAELKMYQVADGSAFNNILGVPPQLYLERIDSATASSANPKVLSIPFDLNPSENYLGCFPSNGIDFAYFGSYPKDEGLSVNGATVVTKVYHFNLSRYVQHIITNKLYNSELRLAPLMYTLYDNCYGATPVRVTSNLVGFGRVKVGGGARSAWPYKMRLRIIYSRL